MHFQQPNFLWGLLLLTLPLIIHLFQFRKFNVLLFPGVHRLKEQLSVAKQTQKIKHWYLLLSRLMAFLFLILAFAMPTCQKSNNVPESKKKIVLIIDCSPSMMLKNEGKVLIEEARTAARKIVNLANASTEFAVIANHKASKQQWVDSRKASELISDAQISEFPENFGTWMVDLDPLLASQTNQDIYLITDNMKDIYEGYKSLDLAKLNLSIIELESPKINNLSIDSAFFMNPILTENAVKILNVMIHASTDNFSGKSVVQLLSGDKLIGSQEVIFENENFKEVKFQVPEQVHGSMKLQLEDQAITVDNTLFLHETQKDICKISQRGNNGFFQKLIKTQSIFQLKENYNFQPNIDASTILLLELDGLTPEKITKIDQLASDGKNILAVLEKDIPQAANLFGLNGKWKSEKVGLSGNGLLNDIFKGIFTSEIDQKTQLPFVEQYFQLDHAQSNQNWQSILTLENGDPLLVQKDFGKGSIWVWLSDFKVGSSSFAKSTWFLPVFTQILLGKSIESQPILGFVHSKQPLLFASNNNIKIENGGVLKLDKEEWIATIEPVDQNLGLNTHLPLKRAGVYQLYLNSNTNGFIEIALNSQRLEKDLKPIDEEFKAKMQNLGVKFVKNSSLQSKFIMVNTDQGIWKLCLWISLFFFALEFTLLFYTNYQKTVKQ